MKRFSEYSEAQKKLLRRIGIIAGAVVLAVLVVVVGYRIWEKPPELAESTPRPVQSTAAPAAPSAKPAAAGTTAPATPEPEEDDWEGALLTDRSDGVYTALLVGSDKASGCTDTIMVGRFDTKHRTVDVVSIPRDTLLNIGWVGTLKKINTIYPAARGSGMDAPAALRKQIKSLLGFDVDCYMIVDLDSAIAVVDAIGGVTFDVPVDMDYDDPTQDFHVHVKAGLQKLNGADTIGVFRFRNTYSGGDIQRIGVQHDLLYALAKQMLSLGNIPNLSNVISILTEGTETDLTAANMAFFARQFLRCDEESIRFHTMPYGGSTINGYSFVNVAVDDWLEMVNEYISPYETEITRSDVNILTVYGTNAYATNGSVAGGMDSFVCLVCGESHGPNYGCPEAEDAEEDEDGEDAEDGEDTEDGETAEPGEEGEAPDETAVPPDDAEAGGEAGETETPEDPGTQPDGTAGEEAPPAEETPADSGSGDAGDSGALELPEIDLG